MKVAVTSFSCKRGMLEEKMAIGNGDRWFFGIIRAKGAKWLYR